MPERLRGWPGVKGLFAFTSDKDRCDDVRYKG
jgi:hypothetical protein